MAGHGSAPPATGWEGEVRKVLKEDWQVVCGIMGFYTTLYLISKLFTGGAKAVPEAGTCVWGGFGWFWVDGFLDVFCFWGGARLAHHDGLPDRSPSSCLFLLARKDDLFICCLER